MDQKFTKAEPKLANHLLKALTILESVPHTLQSFWHRNSRTRLGHNYRNEYQDSINKSVITRIYRGIFGNIQNWMVQFHFIQENIVFVFKHYVKHFLSIPEPWFGIF